MSESKTLPHSAEAMSLKAKSFHLIEAIFVVLTLGAAFALLYYTNAAGVPFKSFTESDILSIITSMFVVAVFMERSIEAILTPIRAPDRSRMEKELEDIKKAAKSDVTMMQVIATKERELKTYRLQTAQRAYWLSFILGLLISVAGIRTLSGLVNPEDLKALGVVHRHLFSFVDIVLTSGVIAGGSAAIDKIGRAISEFFNLKSATSANKQNQ